ncbi:acetyltransferase [Vibrio cincinnatiensis]|nr:acetyltransferase [Vibrio cincinnatiensis]
MRCLPLNAALCTSLKSFLKIKLVHSAIMRYSLCMDAQ